MSIGSRKKLLITWLIGLISGFTIMITGNTLNFWLSKEEIDIKTIGVFALISVPYAINFIWAPIFDLKNIPLLSQILGHRKSWIIVIQILLGFVVFALSIIEPAENLLLFGIVALIISFLTSAQDTILGALKTEIIDSTQQGQVSGLYVFGYRIGMLLSSSGAIYIAAHNGWSFVYKIFSVVIILFSLMILLLVKENIQLNYLPIKVQILREPSRKSLFCKIKILAGKILNPLGNSNQILLILLFLILYRLPDNFISMMINPFLLHVGYSDFEIATAGKFFGITSAIIGSLLAGYVMKYFAIFESLVLFGIFHGIAHIFFIIQEVYGKNIYIFFLVTGFESVTGGMTMAAYIAYIASLCRGKFRATQYSFLTAMMGLSRSIFPSLSGYIVYNVGWNIFFLFASIASIPPIILVLYLKRSRINKIGI